MIMGDAHNADSGMWGGGGQSDELVSTIKVSLPQRSKIVGTNECNQPSRYKSMKGENEPEFCEKTVHMGSNLAIITAAVFSILNSSWAPRWSCASDVNGGRLKTFNPHPTSTCVNNMPYSIKEVTAYRQQYPLCLRRSSW